MRVGAAYTQTGVLAKGRAKDSAGKIEELGREERRGRVLVSIVVGVGFCLLASFVASI